VSTVADHTASEHAAHEGEGGFLAHHFTDQPQQKQAALVGMWAFLATEVLFFGTVFVTFTVYRS